MLEFVCEHNALFSTKIYILLKMVNKAVPDKTRDVAIDVLYGSVNVLVVNCFQESYLWHTDNNYLLFGHSYSVLWIAFKNRIFDTLTTTEALQTRTMNGCELLSRIVSLTHWQQHIIMAFFITSSCELLSRIVSLTHWQQRRPCFLQSENCCELLSRIVSLTHWQQRNG